MSRFNKGSKSVKGVTPSAVTEVKPKPFLIRKTGEIKKLEESKACIYQTLRDQESPNNIDSIYEQAQSTLGDTGVEYDDDIVLHKLATLTYGYEGPTAYTKDEFETYLATFKAGTVDETRILVCATKETSLKSKMEKDGKDAFVKEYTGGNMAGNWHVFGFHRTKIGKADCMDQQGNNKESGTKSYVVYLVWGRGDKT